MKRFTKHIKIISYFVIIFSLAITPLKAFAVDYGFYSANNIIFYDPEDTSCSETSTNTSTITGSENLEKILNFFTGKGLSLAAAAGIAGNLYQESGYLPTDIQGTSTPATSLYEPVSGVGFGIAQWTYTSRQKPLVDMAKTQKASIIDLNFQLDYMWDELTTTYKAVLEDLNTIKSDTIIGSTSAPMFAAIVFHGRTPKIADNPSKEVTDVVESSIGFHTGYEGSDDSTETLIDNRGKTAESVFNTYKGKIADGTGVTNITIETGSSYSATTSCGSAAGDATWPDNVEAKGKGWSLKDGVDYSNVPCAEGSIDSRTYLHPTHGFTLRLCSTKLGEVSSLISAKVVAMINSAAQAGITLTGDGWRSYATQTEMRKAVDSKGNARCPDPINSKASECTPPLAKPGDSEHERGLAIDVTNIMSEGKGGTAWNWLVANAASYGFYNLPSEEWHWSMSGN